jgi:5'-AMP-activated protein kinase, regulatory gamma subunit
MSDQANESANQSSDQQTLLPSIVYPTKFTWHYEGKVVHLCGSFTNWLETVPMRLEQSNAGLNTNESMISGSAGGNNNNVFSVVCNLPSGYHQYKFIVDGEWRHDENLAFIQDPLGNVNNWLFVKKPGGVVAGAAQAAVVSQAMSAGFGAVGWDGQQSGMMIGGASSRPVPVAGVHNNANVNIGQQQQQQQGGGGAGNVQNWLSNNNNSNSNNDDSGSDSMNKQQQQQQQHYQQRHQQQHVSQAQMSPRGRDHTNNNNSDNVFLGDISPERAQRHNMSRDDNAAAGMGMMNASAVVDAGMDWVSGGINGLQIKRDGDGRRKSINFARDGSQSGGASQSGGSAQRLPVQPYVNNNDYVEQQQQQQQQGANAEDYASDASRARVLEFLQRHTAYELIPESNKVVVFDINLPVRQAFHAFYEQQLAAAPLWNPARGDFSGMISAGEFIDLLRVLSEAFKDVPQVTEEDLDKFTIARAREECGESVDNAQLLSVRPEDSLHLVALVLLKNNMYSVPVVSYGGTGGKNQNGNKLNLDNNVGHDSSKIAQSSATANSRNERSSAQLLHVTNLAEIFACLHRHFRGVPSSLPLFSQPLGALPIGTWTKEFGGRRSPSDSLLCRTNSFSEADAVEAKSDEQFFGNLPEHLERLAPLRCVLPQTTLADAFTMMNGVSCLPIVDETGRLIDVYARSDVVKLASNNAYLNVNMDEFSISRALTNSRQTGSNGSLHSSYADGNSDMAMDGTSMNTIAGINKPPSPKWTSGANSPFVTGAKSGSSNAGGFSTCTRSDTLRAAVEGLGLPGVKRLIVIDERTGALEGIIALSDVMRFLLR